MTERRSCDMSGACATLPPMSTTKPLETPGDHIATTIVWRWELMEWLKRQPGDRMFRTCDACHCIVHTFFTESGKDWNGTIEAKYTRTRMPDGTYVSSKNSQWLQDFIITVDYAAVMHKDVYDTKDVPDISAAKALEILIGVPY